MVHLIGLMAVLLLTTGCQLTYLFKNAYTQAQLLRKRVPISEVISTSTLTNAEKKKLELSVEAKKFAEEHLGLVPSDNYSTFVQLEEPYVTYVLSASPKFELTHYLWSYPLFGDLPYRGYFNKDYAAEEEEEFKQKNYDTYLRGVAAYSTLGWFEDPIYSSMLRYSEHGLVNTIIHETVHATIYIKGQADFNERLATFVGNRGTEKFYQSKEGSESQTLKEIHKEIKDDALFSAFISEKIRKLKQWYIDHKETVTEETRHQELRRISEDFTTYLLPQMKTNKYEYFKDLKLNNALLLNYQTYMKDHEDFERLFVSLGHDFKKLIAFCKSLEEQEDPENFLSDHVKALRN